MKSLFAEIECVQLSVQVSIKTPRLSGIALQNFDQFMIHLAIADEAHRGNVHAFLETFGGDRVVISGNITSNIMPMPDRRQMAEKSAFKVKRTDQFKIGKMGPTFVRIIEYPSFTRLNTPGLCGFVDHRLDCKSHSSDKNRES